MSASPFDIGVVIALPEEFAEFHNQISERCEISCDNATGCYYYVFEHTVGNDLSYRCVATLVGAMGPTQTGLATQRLGILYNPDTFIMLGIAAGISTDVRLGDVVIASQVEAYMENSKAVDKVNSSDVAEEGEFSFEMSGESYRTTAPLVTFSQNFPFAFGSEFQRWQDACASDLSALFPDRENLDQLVAKDSIRKSPHLLSGHIASGPTVVAAESFIRWLKKKNRKFLALEMEAAGLLAAVHEEANPKRTLVIRAVSDYGDDRKGELDKTNSGAFRRYAIRNAISLLWTFLAANVLSKAPGTMISTVGAIKAGSTAVPIGQKSKLQSDSGITSSVPIGNVNILSKIIEAGQDSDNPMETNDPTAARELSIRFLTLPQYKRILLARRMGLLKDEGMSQTEELSQQIVQRAVEDNKLAELWDEVNKGHGISEDRQNPFSRG
jgi:nucleoside phosphorylase